jgi:hypothetical protein
LYFSHAPRHWELVRKKQWQASHCRSSVLHNNNSVLNIIFISFFALILTVLSLNAEYKGVFKKRYMPVIDFTSLAARTCFEALKLAVGQK